MLHYDTGRASKTDRADVKAPGKGREKYQKASLELMTILNGDWSTQGLVHFCENEECCGGYNRRISVARAVAATLKFLLASAPGSPEHDSLVALRFLAFGTHGRGAMVNFS